MMRHNQETSSSSCSWPGQLNPSSSCLSSAAVSFILEFILATIHHPGLIATADKWVTVVDAMATPPQLDFLQDKVLLVAGVAEQVGAELLQLLLPAAGLNKLVIRVNDGNGETRQELERSLNSAGFPVVFTDTFSQGG